jgi:hypothetical protein
MQKVYNKEKQNNYKKKEKEMNNEEIGMISAL